MKKIFAILLACAMFLPLLASCGTMQAGMVDLEAYPQDVIYDDVADAPVIGYVPTTGENELRTELGDNPSEYDGSLDWADFAWYLKQVGDPVDTSQSKDSDEDGFTDYYETTRTVKVQRKAADGNVYTINTANEFMAFLQIRKVNKGATFFSEKKVEKKNNENDVLVDNNITVKYVISDNSTFYFENVTIKLATDVVINQLADGVTKVEDVADFKTTNQTPVINAAAYFKGTFDGQRHVISGVYFSCKDSGERALFGPISGGTVNVLNLSVVDSLVVTATAAANNVGVLFAVVSGTTNITFENVYVDACIVEPATPKVTTNVGGFITSVSSDGVTVAFNNCVFAGSIKTTLGANVGGLVGHLQKGTATFTNCANYADITADCAASNRGAGGLAGMIDSASSDFIDCTNFGTVESTVKCAGGLLGYIQTSTKVSFKKCVNQGGISTGGSYAGGLVGGAFGGGSITNCFNTGAVSANSDYVGGLVGYTKNGLLTITGGSNTGSIIGNGEGTGGAVGWSLYATSISDFTNIGAVSGAKYVGGVLGVKANSAGDLTIKDVTNKGNVSGTSDSIGGIIGDFVGTVESVLTFNNCDNTGAVSATVDSDKGRYVGGIAGSVRTDSNAVFTAATFTDCDNSGNVTGNGCSGGLIGGVQYLNSLTVENCRNVVKEMKYTIRGTSTLLQCGGLIGMIADTKSAAISGCEVIGAMSVNDYSDHRVVGGGLIGGMVDALTDVSTAVSISNCYVNLDFDTTEFDTSGSANEIDVLQLVYGEKGAWDDTNQKAVSEIDSLTITGITYDAVDDLAPVNADVTATGKQRTIKPVGMQTKDNGDGTYSLRYVYGVSGLSDLDVAIGFDVTVQIEGQEAREVTVYCPTLYTSIKAGEETHTNTAEGVDYLFTLEIANVPATELDFDETKVYLKNGQLSIQPFTCAEKVWNENELRFKREDLVTTIAK